MKLFTKQEPSAGWRGASADGRLIYAVGDIHGRYDLVIDLMARISRDRAQSPQRQAVLVFCGDYVDRGPDSAKVVEAMIWLSGQPGFETRFLLGNHEAAFMAFLTDPTRGESWMRYGGDETLVSYGIEPPRQIDGSRGLEMARDALLAHIPPSHLRFLRELETIVEVGDYAMVHAGIRPGVPLGEQEDTDLIWIREDFIGHPGPFEKIIVHGHTWVDDQPRLLSHRIGIDTGAWRTGVLTAVRIEDGDVRMIQARGRSEILAAE